MYKKLKNPGILHSRSDIFLLSSFCKYVCYLNQSWSNQKQSSGYSVNSFYLGAVKRELSSSCDDETDESVKSRARVGKPSPSSGRWGGRAGGRRARPKATHPQSPSFPSQRTGSFRALSNAFVSCIARIYCYAGRPEKKKWRESIAAAMLVDTREDFRECHQRKRQKSTLLFLESKLLTSSPSRSHIRFFLNQEVENYDFLNSTKTPF